jgi:hypothetical protein
MQAVGSSAILIGMAVAFVAQIVGAIVVFRVSVLKGVLSLLVPGYILLVLKRQGLYKPIIGAWLAGLLGIVAGTIILS